MIWTRNREAEEKLEALRALHRGDEFGSYCLGCHQLWPCQSFEILRGSHG